MWSRKKGKNRRTGRDAVLEVKMRSRDARRGRVRALMTAVSMVGGTAIGALVLWQTYQWALREFVYENEAYAIRRIELRHEGRLRADQIRRWADANLGANLMALDLDRVRHDLERMAWIGWADVQAQRPDCLRIAVAEREPVARVVLWRFGGAEARAWPETNYVDGKGIVLPPLRAEWLKPGETGDFSHLPRLLGLERYSVIPGQPLKAPLLEEALALIRAYDASLLVSKVDLESIDLSAGDGLRGRLRDGSEVVFGLVDFERQMRRWRSIHEYSESRGRVLEWLDLSVTNNLPARWRVVGDVPPSDRTTPPKKSPRRHV